MTFFEEFCYLNSSSIRKSITLMFMGSSRSKLTLLYQNSVTDVSVGFLRHVGAHPNELQHGVSIQSSINLGKTFPRISRIRIIPSTQILARVFVYLPPFISQILDFTCRMVSIVILIYFEWRDTTGRDSFSCQHEKLSGIHLGQDTNIRIFLKIFRRF